MKPTATRSLGFCAALDGRATAAAVPASIVVFMKSRRFMAIPNPQSIRNPQSAIRNPQFTFQPFRRAGFFFGGGDFFAGAGWYSICAR